MRGGPAAVNAVRDEVKAGAASPASSKPVAPSRLAQLR